MTIIIGDESRAPLTHDGLTVRSVIERDNDLIVPLLLERRKEGRTGKSEALGEWTVYYALDSAAAHRHPLVYPRRDESHCAVPIIHVRGPREDLVISYNWHPRYHADDCAFCGQVWEPDTQEGLACAYCGAI